MKTTEAHEQRVIFNWAEYQAHKTPELRLLHHIPNGGTRDPREAHNLRLQGVKAGVPDICLPVPRGRFHGLYIELKRDACARMSEAQKGWIESLNAQGYFACRCNGADDGIEIIRRYLRGEL